MNTHGMDAPSLSPENDWAELDMAQPRNTQGSFVSGEPDGQRLRVRYYRRPADGALVGKVWFGPGALGPPGHAHGGSMAAVLDEAMGLAAWVAGHRVVAARLEVDFKNMMPLGTVATMEVTIAGVEGRKVHMAGVLRSPDGTAFAESRGLFIQLSAEKVEQLRDIWNGGRSGSIA
jgi:acyl-coenzyme A thioesterase PaaI-like protein